MWNLPRLPRHVILICLLSLLLALPAPARAQAAPPSPSLPAAAESLRAALVQVQIQQPYDPAAAQATLAADHCRSSGGLIMRAVRAAIAVIVMVGLVGCGSSKSPVMPEVVGKKLDVALSDVKRAGFSNDVDGRFVGEILDPVDLDFD